MNLSKNQWIGVAIALLVIAFFFGAGNIFFSLFNTSPDEGIVPTDTMSEQNIAPDQSIKSTTTSDGLIIQDIVIGTGTPATVGSEVSVNYVGTFSNGTKFDSSYDRGEPFSLTLGAGDVIKGWDEGLVGMKVGGKRHLVIPPSLGYGNKDRGPIPGNSTLIFDVELLGVK